MLEKRFPLSVPSVLAILLFVAVSGMSPASSAAPRVPGPPPATGELEGYVRAVDGNTVDARLDGRRVGIEIIGIRAARANTPCGRAATAYLQSLIDDGVTIEAETGIAHKKYWGMYHLQTARLFVVDNAYLPIHVAPHRSETTVVQVWHAAGALNRRAPPRNER